MLPDFVLVVSISLNTCQEQRLCLGSEVKTWLESSVKFVENNGYLQQLKNYYRVRHYDAQAKEEGKYAFYYHKQTQAYAESQLKHIKAESFNNCKMSNCTEHK